RVPTDDFAKPLRQILEVGREAEDRHDLRGDRNVETVFARKAVGGPAERGNDAAQRPVVHVHDPAPGDAPRVEPKGISPVDVVVDQGGEQVVRRGDSVEVPGEVEVDVFHGDDLRVAAARRTALDAKAGPQAGFTQADDRLLADAVEAIAEADGRGRLALAGGGRGDRGHQDELAVGPCPQLLHKIEGDLRLGRTIAVKVLVGNPDALSDLLDRPYLRGPRDLDIAAQLVRHDRPL